MRKQRPKIQHVSLLFTMILFCYDLAAAFTRKVIKVLLNYMEVRLVFDRYIKESLKARTRRKRTSGKKIRYKVSDSTKILSISIKSLVPHINTKQDLTVYLAEKSKVLLAKFTKNVSLHTILLVKVTWQNFLSKWRPMTTKKQTL